MSKHERMCALYKRDEHGFCLGESIAREKQRAFLGWFFVEVVVAAMAFKLVFSAIRWLIA